MNEDKNNYPAWNALTVGVSDLDKALDLWRDKLGFKVSASSEGDDSELAKLWSLKGNDIARQALIRCDNSDTGMLHLVQFNLPDQPVRKGANNFDLVPKNLDIYVNDLPKKVAELRAAGVDFRTATHSDIKAADGTHFREIHMPSHDHINVVLIEIVGEPHAYNQAGIAGVGPFVFTVPNVEIESEFFTSMFRVDKLHENIFLGSKIEKMIGLPAGTALKIFIMGRKGHDLGKLEIVEYQGANGDNLYPRAKPKALGILQMNYVVESSQLLKQRLHKANILVNEHPNVSTLLGTGDLISFSSPAGLKIEVYSRA